MRPNRDQMLMEMAIVASSRGTCSRAQVGVVIAREGRVLSTGYNGAPAGMPHCDHTCQCRFEETGWKVPNSFGYDHSEGCPARNPCTTSVHAEVNAIAYAARHGVALLNSDLYTTMQPCLACAQVIINSGITRVVFQKPYRLQEGIYLLQNAGIALAGPV